MENKIDIEENATYTKLTKVGEKRKNLNGMQSSGVLHTGKLRIRVEEHETGEPYMIVTSYDGYYFRSSPIQSIVPIVNGYSIITENSIYEIVQ